MAMCSACSPISSTGTHTPTSRAFGGLRFQRTFLSAAQEPFGNLSGATTAPGMPASPLIGDEANAMTTRLALNSKGWKEVLLKRRSTKHLQACAQQSSKLTRWRISPDTSTLRREENLTRDLGSTGFCYKISWLCLIDIYPELLEDVLLFTDFRPLRVSDSILWQVSTIEALQASATQNPRKATPVLGMLSKRQHSSGSNTVS